MNNNANNDHLTEKQQSTLRYISKLRKTFAGQKNYAASDFLELVNQIAAGRHTRKNINRLLSTAGLL